MENEKKIILSDKLKGDLKEELLGIAYASYIKAKIAYYDLFRKHESEINEDVEQLRKTLEETNKELKPVLEKTKELQELDKANKAKAKEEGKEVEENKELVEMIIKYTELNDKKNDTSNRIDYINKINEKIEKQKELLEDTIHHYKALDKYLEDNILDEEPKFDE